MRRSTLIFGLPSDALADVVSFGCSGVGHACYGWRGAFTPEVDEKGRSENGEKKDYGWHDPGGVIEASADGSSEDGGTVLGGEPVEDAGFCASRGKLLAEFVDHAAGIGAADVIALQQDLAAATGAHHLVADVIEAVGDVSCSAH